MARVKSPAAINVRNKLNFRMFFRSSRWFFFTSPLRFYQKNQEQEKWYQGQNEKNRPAMVMNGRINHFRTDMNAKLSDDKHPETISKQRQRNHSQAQSRPFPRTAQKKMRGDQARDKKRKS